MGKLRPESLQARKELIVNAAITCFVTKSFQQTGMRDIAKQAGVSLGNLYNYFSGKSSILQEIANLEEAEIEPIIQMMLRPTRPLAGLLAFVEAYSDYVSQPESVLLTLDILTEAMREPDIAAIFERNRMRLVNATCQILEAGSEDGEMRSFDDLSESACLILDLIEGQATRYVLKSRVISVSARQELINTVTRIVSCQNT